MTDTAVDAGPADDQVDPPIESLRTIGQIIRRAESVLEQSRWDFAAAGGGEEVTLRRNRAAFRQLALVPSVLHDVSDVDVSTTFLGMELALPVMLAPVGALSLYHPDGALAAARGAADQGTVAIVGMLTEPRFSEVQQATGGRHLFQIYINGDAAWVDALVDRAAEAGARGLCVTVDSDVEARRDRVIEGFDWKHAPRRGELPNLEGLGRDRAFQRSFTWADLERLRSRTELPLVLKGVLTPEDARRAVDTGVDAVYVSNHGGRGVDHAPSTIEMLAQVVDAVGGRAEVVLDSGIQRGTDICKALALGARAVAVGRLQCWGLAVGGADGVAQVLKVLRAEMENTMALMGARNLGELTPARVRPTIPV